MPKVADRVLMFAPERWGEVDRFLSFYHHTYSFPEWDKRAPCPLCERTFRRLCA